jgi:hypothetical protein
MYFPPLYVLSPAEIQRASEAMFTLPSWNKVITQVMAEHAAAFPQSHVNTTTSIPID